MIIAVDFDGTVVKHEFPKVGGHVVGAIETLKTLVEKGHQIVLWTMRSGETLQDAVNWYKENGIPLYGVNENPQQNSWTESPKAYAQIYIDDAALGCPLIVERGEERPYVDWKRVSHILTTDGIL